MGWELVTGVKEECTFRHSFWFSFAEFPLAVGLGAFEREKSDLLTPSEFSKKKKKKKKKKKSLAKGLGDYRSLVTYGE